MMRVGALARPLFYGGRCSSMSLVLRHGLLLYLPQITYSYIGINANYVALHDIQENQQMKYNIAIHFIRCRSNQWTMIHLTARHYLLIRLVHRICRCCDHHWSPYRTPPPSSQRKATAASDSHFNMTSTFELKACCPCFVILLRLTMTCCL
jgi:hypothetical protein